MSELKNKTSLKGYRSQLEKMKGDRDVLLFKQKGVEREIRDNDKRIKALERKINTIENSKLSITEHAILRYIERIEVCNPADVPAKILTPKLEEMVNTTGGEAIYPLENCRVKVRNKTVVTVLKYE